MSNDDGDFSSLRKWIDRQETREDVVTAAPVEALAVTLDRDAADFRAGSALPPLWHWLYFLPCVAQSQLGPDGHPARGGFLPPVSLPRRMWAGSNVRFHRPLILGERIRRVSTIADVQHKQGRSGDLVFVTVRHDITSGDTLAISEEQHIVYRAPAAPSDKSTAGSAAARPVAGDQARRAPAFRDVICPDPVLLFRYSALTFNSHRIHYDRPYATEVEGYPGLVVHGPLLATLLLEALHRHVPVTRVARFEFRAQRPLFDTSEFAVEGKPDGEAWMLSATDKAGNVAVEAKASGV
jgi:3-methylfumaryl-CoA hydratase